MGSAGQNGCHNIAKAKGPGVVIGRSGASMGKVHYSENDYWPHNTCLYVTDFLGNSPRFAYYVLSTLDLAGFNSGSAQPSLNRNYIYGMPLRIPHRIEQDAIVGVLRSSTTASLCCAKPMPRWRRLPRHCLNPGLSISSRCTPRRAASHRKGWMTPPPPCSPIALKSPSWA